MKKAFPSEFIYQVFSLLIAFIIVHAVYVTLVRPQAEAFMVQEAANMHADPAYVQQRSFWVVIKDYEQETCFILMLWAIAILGYKGRAAFSQHRLLDQDLLRLPENLPIGPEDTRDLIGRLHELPGESRHFLLPTALMSATQRFASTRNIQDAATAVRTACDTQGDRLDSELSIIRYVAWAIPSVGFIGTVRGIGSALAQAHRAVEGDITGVTQSLGVAFNSTFIALVLSIILMFFIHQLQLRQERLILDADSYCHQNLINKLRTKPLP